MLKQRIFGWLFLQSFPQKEVELKQLLPVSDELKASLSKQICFVFLYWSIAYTFSISHSMYVDFLHCTKTQWPPHVHYDTLLMPDIYLQQWIQGTARWTCTCICFNMVQLAEKSLKCCIWLRSTHGKFNNQKNRFPIIFVIVTRR